FFLLMLLCTPFFISFPYTTLFRSVFDVFTSIGRADIDGGASPAESVTNFTALCLDPILSNRKEIQIFPALCPPVCIGKWALSGADRKSTRLNSSHVSISYAVFCLK